MDASNIQDMNMMSANSSAVPQSSAQGSTQMSTNQQGSSSANSLLYTGTIYTQDMSAIAQNNQQQMMQMHQNRLQSNESSQAMMSDLNPFISGAMGMDQQQQAQQSAESEKEAYKGKCSRGYLRAQLP